MPPSQCLTRGRTRTRSDTPSSPPPQPPAWSCCLPPLSTCFLSLSPFPPPLCLGSPSPPPSPCLQPAWSEQVAQGNLPQTWRSLPPHSASLSSTGCPSWLASPRPVRRCRRAARTSPFPEASCCLARKNMRGHATLETHCQSGFQRGDCSTACCSRG